MTTAEEFKYTDIRFADIQVLRYRLDGFAELTLRQKALVYCLAEAALCGRDIIFDQFGRHNLRIRRTLEAVYTGTVLPHDTDSFDAFRTYLRRVWFSDGIYHHYGADKFVPDFSEAWLRAAVRDTDPAALPLHDGETPDMLLDALAPVMFDPAVLPKRVDKTEGADMVTASACNYYDGVTQREVEEYYAARREADRRAGAAPVSYGLNTRVVKTGGKVTEEVWRADGLYGGAIRRITHWLRQAAKYAENDAQRRVIQMLIRYYESGDLHDFDDYSVEWVKATDGRVDFINGFIEVYGDPLGMKGSWEGVVEYVDTEATRRTETVSRNAQWFEDHSPVDPCFRKPTVRGVTAKAVCVAMLGGEEYPSSAIGINLPNADYIRAEHGSKSVTLSNLTRAYDAAAAGSGMKEEFVIDDDTRKLLYKYGDRCDDLHTDLHECLGHGSGRLLDGTDPAALKSYGNTIEEARADLYALYFLADPKIVELGLLPDREAYKAGYYAYVMNGLLTQLARIAPGHDIEEAHMRNRALIARWCVDNGSAVMLVSRGGKTFVSVTDYAALRALFARLLAEIQRIKSCGDYDAARRLVEQYAVYVDPTLHKEVLARYGALGIAPYKGFINPRLVPVKDNNGTLTDIVPTYDEGYDEQMLRYSRDYATLI